MIDICAEQGWLATVLRIQQLLQCIVQARWLDDPVVLTLPYVEEQNVPCFKALKMRYDFWLNLCGMGFFVCLFKICQVRFRQHEFVKKHRTTKLCDRIV